MSTQQHTADQQVINRYTDQPIRLPVMLRAQIEAIWGGQQVQLYALYDLDRQSRLGERWIAVGKDYIAVAEHDDVVGDWLIDSFGRSRVRGAFEAPMLSGNVLWILAGRVKQHLPCFAQSQIVIRSLLHYRNRHFHVSPRQK